MADETHAEPDWRNLGALPKLRQAGRQLLKIDGRQIALFDAGGRIRACANRCPHEGYPLIEGDIAGCRLTCNWHSWSFDLASGDTLVGGDRLRVYPVEERAGEIWVDLAELPAAERRERALGEMHAAFEDHDYDRIARSLARFQAASGAIDEALAMTLGWAADRYEYGTTHATPAAADWLSLAETFARDDVERMAAEVEALGHFAWDAMGGRRYPFTDETRPWNEDDFLAAIEAQGEDAAIARLNGALAAGLGYEDIEETLTRAALSHYAGFGHATIYLTKAGELLERLGARATGAVLRPLVRYFTTASREDLIPEFRRYGTALEAWDGAGHAHLTAEALSGASISRVLALTSSASGDVPSLYRALLGAAALNLLRFDVALQNRIEQPIAKNVGWLDFTHALTFANAVRRQCTRFPALWPQALLQMACFVGRNAGFVDRAIDWTHWRIAERGSFLAEAKAGLFDHGETHYIYSAHRLKTTLAVEEELAHADPETAELLIAALNRYLNAPMKRKNVKRSAYQALDFVANEA